MKLTNVFIPGNELRSNNLLKSFGHKDVSKLQKKTITNKAGKRQTVYVKDLNDMDRMMKKHWGFKKHNSKEKDTLRAYGKVFNKNVHHIFVGKDKNDNYEISHIKTRPGKKDIRRIYRGDLNGAYGKMFGKYHMADAGR